MGLDVVWSCDICGKVGGTVPSRNAAVREAKGMAWTVLVLKGKLRLACLECRFDIGDGEPLRRKMMP